jgi:hypothetical protein
MAKLMNADESLVAAVRETLAALDLKPVDRAAAVLARKYAKLIDEADDLASAMDRYGPRLFACLESLGATPASRRPAKGGGGPVPVAGQTALERIRASRR